MVTRGPDGQASDEPRERRGAQVSSVSFESLDVRDACLANRRLRLRKHSGRDINTDDIHTRAATTPASAFSSSAARTTFASSRSLRISNAFLKAIIRVGRRQAIRRSHHAKPMFRKIAALATTMRNQRIAVLLG